MPRPRKSERHFFRFLILSASLLAFVFSSLMSTRYIVGAQNNVIVEEDGVIEDTVVHSTLDPFLILFLVMGQMYLRWCRYDSLEDINDFVHDINTNIPKDKESFKTMKKIFKNCLKRTELKEWFADYIAVYISRILQSMSMLYVLALVMQVIDHRERVRDVLNSEDVIMSIKVLIVTVFNSFGIFFFYVFFALYYIILSRCKSSPLVYRQLGPNVLETDRRWVAELNFMQWLFLSLASFRLPSAIFVFILHDLSRQNKRTPHAEFYKRFLEEFH